MAAARALVTRPEIIFADEPTGNLDSHAGGDLLAFLRLAVDEFGQTIVMVTHDPAAAAVSDRIVFLKDGRVVDEMLDPTADRAIDHMKRLGADPMDRIRSLLDELIRLRRRTRPILVPLPSTTADRSAAAARSRCHATGGNGKCGGY